jgi:hypothetical protein
VETIENDGSIQIATRLCQFLTLLCSNGTLRAWTDKQLAEAISELSTNSGPGISDFILNSFRNNPTI